MVPYSNWGPYQDTSSFGASITVAALGNRIQEGNLDRASSALDSSMERDTDSAEVAAEESLVIIALDPW